MNRFLYDLERAKAAVRSYQLRRLGDPQPAGELPWWRKGCQPFTPINMPAPNLPGESKERALRYAALASVIQAQLIRDPEAALIAIYYLTPIRSRVVPLKGQKKPHTGEIHYVWPSLRQVGRRFGLDHSSVTLRVRRFLKAVCHGMHDPEEGDYWYWKVKRKKRKSGE